MTSTRLFAVVTGGSNGIGLELARDLAGRGYDLLIAAEDKAHLDNARRELSMGGTQVETHAADLATEEGVDSLYRAAGGRTVDVLCVNAGVGLGGRFQETDLQRELRMIDLNVRGAVQLTKLVLRDMVARDQGRILITSSIAGTMPDPFEAVYGGTKVFLRWFAEALYNEMKGTGVTVTALLPSVTDTNFFRRADMMDTRAGQMSKDDPAVIAKGGIEAMLAGRDKAIPTVKNKVMAAIADALPDKVAAHVHRGLSEPGSANKSSGSNGVAVATGAAALVGLALFAGRRLRSKAVAGSDGVGGSTEKALHIRLQARPGREQDAQDLLFGIYDRVKKEPATRPWYGTKRANGVFEIFETFPDAAGREAHLSGKAAALLKERSGAVLVKPAEITKLDVIAKKLPETTVDVD